jgi:hypothetical protein
VLKYLKRNWYLIILGLIIVLNIGLLIRNYISRQVILAAKAQSQESGGLYQSPKNDFINQPCPDITAISTKGEKVEFRNFAGSIILIRFSRFYRQDLPNIVYLQELAGKYEKAGVHLIFCNSRGIHDPEVNKIINLSFPVIEDKGEIRTQFNALPEDTIIIDRDSTVKFMSDRASKAIIHDELLKWIQKSSPPQTVLPKAELSRAIRDLIFFDIRTNTKTRIGQFPGNLIVTVSSSLCTGCEENGRLQLLRRISQDMKPGKSSILIIFGKGNNIAAIRQYSLMQGWDKLPFIVGAVEDPSLFGNDHYYDIFQLDVDPKTYVIDSQGNLDFLETRKTSKSVGFEQLSSFFK